jgi:hypothetical protein
MSKILNGDLQDFGWSNEGGGPGNLPYPFDPPSWVYVYIPALCMLG